MHFTQYHVFYIYILFLHILVICEAEYKPFICELLMEYKVHLTLTLPLLYRLHI